MPPLLHALSDRGTVFYRRLRRFIRPLLPPSPNFFVASLSGVHLPAEGALRRDKPRPVELQDEKYARDYDDTTLFYDVFQAADRVVAIGPPLFNLSTLVTPDKLALDDRPATLDHRDVQIFYRSTIEGHGTTLSLDAVELGGRLVAGVQPAHLDVFAGRRVLLTISKDNRLDWIADWADFHVRAHGVDAVLIYDNGSRTYSPADLLDRLRRVPGLAAVVIVPWHYKFGPVGRPDGTGWESKFAQPAMWEHARHRFLKRAAALVNADIDELIVAESGGTLFDHLARSKSGAITYAGRWISPVRRGIPWGRRRFRHYRHLVKNEPLYLDKWTCVPAMIPDDVQFTNHFFLGSGFEATPVPEIVFRHFRAITTNWKYNRTKGYARYRRSKHVVDEAWVRQMRDIGWSD
jgi:hypothetical protein